MKIRFIQAGGSIDKDYLGNSASHGYNFLIDKPASSMILERVKPKFSYEKESVIKKDSLDLVAEDREKIYQACKNSPEDKIIITHGTDMIQETAQKLDSIKDKIIVLVGAMRPAQFWDSDAPFNIGLAVGGVQTLTSGIYIVMHGIIYPWQEYKK